MNFWTLNRLILLTVLLTGAALRLYAIGAQSFWHDEALTVTSASVPLRQVVDSVRQSENCPPGYFILINLWSKAFGLSDVSLRLPSALFGIATIALLYRLGKELFDERVGLTAAALLAVSPFHIAYSQEARPYALWLFLQLLCVCAFVRMMRKGSGWWQVAYVATAAASLWTHTFAVFTLAGLNLFYLWRLVRRQETGVSLRRWIVLHADVVLLFGAWIPATREVAAMGLPWMLKATPVLETMTAYAGDSRFAAMVMLSACGAALYIARKERNDWGLLLAAIVIVPVLVPILYGVFIPRYGIAALIGLTLLPAYAFAQLGRSVCIAFVVLALITNLGTVPTKPDFRAVAHYLIDHGRSDDVLIHRSDAFSGRVLDYYLAGKGPRRLTDFPPEPPARTWMTVTDLTPLPAFRIVENHRFSGVNLLLLEPVAATQRSD